MNRIKLHKQVETMNKEQLICLCKSLININCELEDRKDKAIEYIDRMTRVIDYNDDEFITWEHIIDIENILRGEDNDNN